MLLKDSFLSSVAYSGFWIIYFLAHCRNYHMTLTIRQVNSILLRMVAKVEILCAWLGRLSIWKWKWLTERVFVGLKVWKNFHETFFLSCWMVNLPIQTIQVSMQLFMNFQTCMPTWNLSLTPVPSVTGRDVPWPLFTFD